jgi:hypothetical protein
MKINEILTEATAPAIGRKYQHIEDLVLSHGAKGGMHAIERMRHMGTEGGHIELKWDGMPVVYWGRDEKGVFRMIPKNAWAYIKRGQMQTKTGAPTLPNSPEDVMKFVLGTGSGDVEGRTGFARQLAQLWPMFEKISPEKGYLEGGLLFYPGTKPDGKSAMPVFNKKTNTLDFTPNITTFHVPIDSKLGQKIEHAKMMVAATGYYATMDSDESRATGIEKLSQPGILVQSTTYVEDPVPVDAKGLQNLVSFIQKNGQLIDNYLAPKKGLSKPGGVLYTYLNQHLRISGLLKDFPAWAKSNLSSGQAQSMLEDINGLKATLGAVEALGNEKQKIINILSQGLHGGIKQTKPEGYAQAHPGAKFTNDIPGQFVKMIDQGNWAPRKI